MVFARYLSTGNPTPRGFFGIHTGVVDHRESFIVSGEHTRGFELLEQSVSGFHPYVYMSQYCRFLDAVREAPRFKAVLATARGLVETFPQKEAALRGPFPV